MWHLKKVSCEFCGFNANAGLLTVLWSVCPTRGWFKTVGVAACAANSSKGANARPVMSGVTRQRFQNTAVNKVKVSRFAGRWFVFMSCTVHGWSNFSKQTSNLYVCLFVFFFSDFKKINQMRFSKSCLFKLLLFFFFKLTFSKTRVFTEKWKYFWSRILKCSFRKQNMTHYMASANHSHE